MAKLAKFQREALELLKINLDPTHPGHTSGDKVREALTAAKVYVDSWVMPLIRQAEGDRSLVYYTTKDLAIAKMAARKKVSRDRCGND